MDPARVHVGPVSAFKEKSRQLVKSGDRNIAVYQYGGQFFALDNACYHHGGPLLEGDIEDMGGHPCIVCPWHQYHITLDTGEGLYWALQMSANGIPDKNAPQILRSKGRKQRTHIVTIENGEVYVTVNTIGPRVESDTYAEMAIANQEKAMSMPMSCSGCGTMKKIHSGLRSEQVFAEIGARNKTRLSGFSEKQILQCVRVEHICDSTKKFYFNICQGELETQLIPGQFVDLKLPFLDPYGKPFVRRWTVIETNKEGCLFSLIIKAARESRGGSIWMLNNALHQKFTIIRVGGNFTFTHHMSRLREVEGRVVVLSAGIGITPSYASLCRYFEEKPEKNVPKFHVLHFHVDRTLSSVVGLEKYIKWHHTKEAYFTYRFNCYLTKQNSNTVMDESLCAITTCGQRPTMEDIQKFVGEFVSTSPVLVFVSGPSMFVRTGKLALLSLGVLESDVLTDENDDGSGDNGGGAA
ncbi:Flavoprotein pyridine nucleotide cytochrome reductase-like [Trypanosoma melophagium]|uniref:Flavoprotein pyridine nucleotide cytochrome reductase-like n=1 Tax=Trypanosoma melophagium TaxID=715481 RepID=UPI00351A8122|nr:Flavoprotein pyridine nucleotide cytochrome reductase-like [Trypanosoma melophagium]